MLLFLDKYGNQLDDMTFIEAQWSRKYNEPGSFILMTTADLWNKNIKYIQNTGRKETAIVQKVVFEKKAEGNFITASGFMLEKALSWGCNYAPTTLTASTETDVKRAVQDLMTKDFGSNGTYKQLSTITFADDAAFPATLNATLDPGTDFGSFLYDILQPEGMSFWCEPVFGSDESVPLLGVKIHTYKGEDRRNEVYFGEGYNDVSNISYTIDESAEYPLYGIMQEVQTVSGFSDVTTINTKDGVKYYIKETIAVDGNRPSDLGACWPLKVINGNVTDMEMVSANQTAIREAMKQQAKLDMLNHYKVETISATVIQNNFLYLKDYDLGDICSTVIDDIEEMFVARIVETSEVIKNNTEEVTLTLGTPQKSKYKKIQIL